MQGVTLMMEAAASGDASILEKLLKQPPVAKNINATDEEGRCESQQCYRALSFKALSSIGRSPMCR